MKKTTLLFLLLFIFSSAKPQLTSSNLPIIVFNTNGQEIVDDPKIMADMGIISNAGNATNHITDPFNEYNGKVGIEIRGQSSQMFPMKSYSLELWDNSGNSINQSIFGLPSESDWVLYAPYNEKTLMHNFLAYTMSREMGHWAANCHYVEVMINNEYKGIYVFMEKIKRKTGRVNISSMSSSDNSGDAVTGGYIFSIDKDANAWYSSYPAGNSTIQFTYVYPKVTSITGPQQAYIKSFTDSFENVLHTLQYQDTINGWRKFADEPSFIDYFIVNELSRNVDGYRISSYFNKDRESKTRKIMAGPVWDYDLAFRNADYCNGSNVDGWAYNFNTVCPGDGYQVPDWWRLLLADTTFQGKLYCRWKELRNSSLSVDHLNHLIDSIVTLTSDARVRHFQQWPVLGQYIWPNPSPIATTYEGEIQTLKSWLGSRLQWIDSNLTRTGACYIPPPVVIIPPLPPPVIVPLPYTGPLVINFSNPVLSNSDLSVLSGKQQQMSLVVTDILGRRILRSAYTLIQGNNMIHVQSASWETGIYIYEFVTGTGEKITRKVLRN